ncbi:MAG: OmpH family outer membrane protein [Chitinophagaceae bacterium]
MKNGLLIWNVVLTLVAGYLLISHLGSKKTGSGTSGKTTARDSAHASLFRIAYFEMDSVENNFEMVKDVKAEIAKKEEDYNQRITNLDIEYRNRYNELVPNAKTQAEVDAAQNNLRILSDKLKTQRQNMDQDYQEFVMRRNLNVKKTIEDYLAEYNKAKNYTYIMAYEPGLFYYKDTVYNITSDLIRGLNGAYKKK